MGSPELVKKAQQYMDVLCREIPTRRLGTQGNKDATMFFQKTIEVMGYAVEAQRFDCIHSQLGPASLTAGGKSFQVYPGPFTLGCDVTAELVGIDTVERLESVDIAGKIILIHGELAKEQLMPKNFEFYNPEEHQHIYRLLEDKKPAAILSATGKNPDQAGAIYPFPMIEDGDFDIPNAFMTDIEGEKLVKFSGQLVCLKIDAERIPTWGENIVARAGDQNRKVVFCAHIDTKENTPGALDNASGVAIMLLLAELLKGYDSSPGIEFAAFNGEEYYNTPGEVEYLRRYGEDFSSVLIAINMDDIGYIKGRTAFSFYGVPDELTKNIRGVYKGRDDFFEGPPWYPSDHGIFMAKGIPAMAITEEMVIELMEEITHTEKDTVELIDFHKLVENAQALADFIRAPSIRG